MTIGVMRALTDLGVRYQEDLSLIGVDDLDWADVMRIRPTLIAQPIEAMTRTAIAALLEQLTTAEPSQKRRILFAPKLTERESCAPPALC
jgi:LacI family transcriptional regulator